MGANQSAQMAAEASHRLALNLLKTISKSESGNIFISPLSIASALSMLYCGAHEDTASEIIEVLGLSGISTSDLEATFDRLLTTLDKTGGGYSLECVNAAVLQKNFDVKDDYKKTLEKSFHAMMMQEDFATNGEAAVDRINKWVDSKTHGMIKKLLTSLSPLTVLVLLNAIYFKGTWKNQFSESSTRPQSFYNNGSKSNSKKVDMMHLKENFDYASFETYQALQLPYKGNDVVMLILLPTSLDGLEEMEKNLTPDFVRTLKEKMRKRKVRVSLPKFRIGYSKSLKETFQLLGIRKAFDDGAANLSGINDSAPIYVTNIFHKAVVEVNEEGTEAAAATAVVIAMRCMTVEPEFTVDHPFLFIIYDTRNDTNLFTGRIVEF